MLLFESYVVEWRSWVIVKCENYLSLLVYNLCFIMDFFFYERGVLKGCK